MDSIPGLIDLMGKILPLLRRRSLLSALVLVPFLLPASSLSGQPPITPTENPSPEREEMLFETTAERAAPPDDEGSTIDTTGPWRQIEPVFSRTVRIIPQEKYDRGGLHRVVYGDLWRDAWGTEIEAPVLDLARTGGGLTPTETGGGNQTRSLRFIGADKREYRFRMMDKDPSAVLPKTLRNTFAADVLQDMISTQTPIAGVIVAPMLDALDIPNAHAFIVVMPDDPRLGEFRAEFANTIGTMEENPTDGEDGTLPFMGFTSIKNSENLYEKLREENDHHVHSIEYLKARLFDLVIGDWDRHRDQYRWWEREVGSESYWLPIPRDRDQAFARYDGILPWLAEENFPELEGLEHNYPDIEELAWAGKTLDRRFLVLITKEQWDSTTRVVVSRLTDEVIEESVRMMPPEMFALDGEWLIDVLKTRRDKLLTGASDEFYELVQSEPEIWGSDQDEYVDVERLDDERVRVSLYRRDKESGEKKGAPYVQHTFHSDDTKEIRIMTLDGDDKVVVRGTVSSSITVKVDAGDGGDELVDESKVKGWLFVLPIPDAETSTYFYDHGGKTEFTLGPGTRIDRRERPEWDHDSAAWHPPVRDYGADWRWMPWLGYDPDEGVFVGLKNTFEGYNFRHAPYSHNLSFGLGYAIGTKAFKFDLTSDFRDWVPNAHVLIDLFASELEVLNFYGLGNETAYDAGLDALKFYDVNQREVELTADVRFPRERPYGIYFGMEGSYTRTKLESSPLLDSLQPYGVEPTALMGARTGVIVDTRNHARAPVRGIYLSALGEFFPALLDNTDPFAKGTIDARTYLTTTLIGPTTLALRIGGQKNIGGVFPYYESAFLGGKKNLRGYRTDRFAGNSSIFGNAELRMHLFNFRIIARSTLGLVLFGETGRVYLNGEDSDIWHYGYGGGLSLSLIKPENVVVVTVGRSEERSMGIFVKFGHMF